MIADLVAMGATIREAVMYSLQISKDIFRIFTVIYSRGNKRYANFRK